MKSQIRFISLISFFSMISIMLACAPAPTPMPEKPVYDDKARVPQDESFDPLTLDEDDIIILPPSQLKPLPGEAISTNIGSDSEAANIIVEAPGYRVQLFSTELEFEARLIEEEALVKFAESVYLIFDSPVYKIRVGDCASRAEANKLRQRAVDLGFQDAWVVQSKVVRAPSR